VSMVQAANDFVFLVEPESLTRSNHRSICGPVWCQFGDIEFPQSHWSDLVVAVLSWSLEATVALVGGRKRNAGIRFLDGPFEVRVFSKRRDGWQAELVEERLTGRAFTTSSILPQTRSSEVFSLVPTKY
jgi:hypothetical protein